MLLLKNLVYVKDLKYRVLCCRWILKSDYLTDSSQAGKLLDVEPYEWYKKGLTEDGAINLEAPRKWRLLREKTGHGAFYGMRIIIYGECIAPPLVRLLSYNTATQVVTVMLLSIITIFVILTYTSSANHETGYSQACCEGWRWNNTSHISTLY